MKFLDGLNMAQRTDTTAPFGPITLHYDQFCQDVLPTGKMKDASVGMAPAFAPPGSAPRAPAVDASQHGRSVTS